MLVLNQTQDARLGQHPLRHPLRHRASPPEAAAEQPRLVNHLHSVLGACALVHDSVHDGKAALPQHLLHIVLLEAGRRVQVKARACQQLRWRRWPRPWRWRPQVPEYELIVGACLAVTVVRSMRLEQHDLAARLEGAHLAGHHLDMVEPRAAARRRRFIA